MRPGIRLLLALAAILALTASSAHAATFVVDSQNDAVDATPGDGTCATVDPACTLRAAVQEANALAGADTISLPASTYQLTITGAGEDAAATGDLDLLGNITITGGGALATEIVNTVSDDRVFDVPSAAATVVASDLTVSSGGASGGGGIRNLGSLTLTRTALRGNISPQIPNGGDGGAVLNDGGTLVIDSTEISGNAAYGNGGAVYVAAGSASIVNSTISDNDSANSIGGIANNGSMTMSYSVVAGNTGPNSLGLASTAGNEPLVTNSIIADNENGDCNSAVVSGGSNVATDTVCLGPAPVNGDVIGDPELQPLNFNGGPTQTRAPAPTSVALDIGQAPCPPTDQRGVSRPQGPGCDAGSFELQPPPNTTIDSGPPAVTTETDATFTFSGINSASSFSCSLDGAAATPCTSPQSYSGLSVGGHTLQVTATGPGGTDPSPANYSWGIVVPDTTIDSGPSGATAGPDATFTFSADASPAAFECSLDGAPFATCTSPQTYTGLANGPHNFQVRAAGESGTDATPATRSFTVVPLPDTSITAGPSGNTTATSASFSFASTEGGATFECSLDGAAFAACASPQAYSGLAVGAHTFAVRAVGATGVDPTPATRSLTVVVPDTTIDSGPSGITSSSDATFTFRATETPASFECSLDGAVFAACAPPRSYTGLADGPHTLAVRATAPSGTDGTPATRSWTITPVPDTAIDSGPSGNTTATTAAFAFSSSELGATFECALDGGAFAACASPKSYTGLGLGAHTLAVRSVGASGTDASPATRSWTVVIPDTAIDAGPAGTIADADAVFAFSASDTPASFECSLDGAAFVPCSSPEGYVALADGEHAFAVRAVGATGADPSPATRSWTIADESDDVDPPVFDKAVRVEPVRGTVLIRIPGTDEYVDLEDIEQIPFGSLVDTTDGRVELEVEASPGGKLQSAVFYDGVFRLVQGRDNVILVLVGGDFSKCPKRDRLVATVSKKKPKDVVQQLWGKGTGDFQVRGKGGSATVRGTQWLTQDRCDGTRVKVKKGVVGVRDFARRKTVKVKAPDQYLATFKR